MALDRLTKVDGGGISTTSDYRVGVITATKFVGPIEGVVTGTATTAVNAQGLIGTPDITVRNIKATGLSTFVGDAQFDGNVSIAGTLTYEDVTNIDSVGLITARDGIFIPNNEKLEFSGSVGSSKIRIYQHAALGSMIEFTSSSTGYIGHNASGAGKSLVLNTGNDFVFKGLQSNGAQVDIARFYKTGQRCALNADGVEKFTTSSKGIQVGTGVTIETNGQATFVGIVTFGSSSTTINGNTDTVNVGTALTIGHSQGLQYHTQNLHAQGFEINQINASGIITASSFRGPTGGTATFQDIDVDGHTNLDNVSIAGVTTFVGNANIANDTGKLQIGASQDLQIYHDYSGGSENSHIYQTTSKHLLISAYTQFARVNGTWGVLNLGNSHNMLRATAGSDVKLYFNNGEKLATTNTGINITGTAVATGADINGDLDVDGHTNLDNVSIAGVTTFAENINLSDKIITNCKGFNSGNEQARIVVKAGDNSAGGGLRIVEYYNDDTTLFSSEIANFYTTGIELKENVSITGDLTIPDSIVHDGDTTCKIRFPSNDNIQFETGGSPRLNITTGGSVYANNFGIGTDDRWKIRPNTSNTELAFEYSTSASLSDSNIKMLLDSTGKVTIGDAATHTFSAHSEGDDLVIGGAGWRGMTIYGEGGGGVIQFADNGDNRIGQILYNHGDNSMMFRTNGNVDRLTINNSGMVQIGGAVGSNSDIDTTNTRLTIKQSANNREDGIYLERTGERRGWLMFVGGSGSYNDAFCLSTNQMGTKTDVLAIDRGNRLAKLGGDVIIDSTNNGYGGLRIYDDTSGGYNVNYVGGRNDGNFCHKFFGGGRSQNQLPWTDASGFEIMRISSSNGLQLAGDTDSALQFHTGDHYKFKTKGRERVHLDNRGVLTAPKLSTKALVFGTCNNKWASQRTVTNFVMQFYTGASSATYHFMRMISQPDWAFDDVEIRQYRYQYNPSGSDHTVRRYFTYYSGHTEQIVRYNQNGSGTGTGNDNYITKRTDFGPGGAFKVHETANGGYYRDLWGSDYAISLGAYYGVVLEIKITATVGIYDTGDYPTAYDFYPANYGGQASQSDANNHGGPRGVWFNTTSNGTGTGTAPVISTKNSDRGWNTGTSFLDTSA